MTTQVYLVTGSSGGLGLEAVRQLALLGNKVYLACRSADQTNDAIRDLVDTKGVAPEKLQYIHFHSSESKEDIDKQLSCLEPLDGVVLNAGGFGHDTTHKPLPPNNVLEMIQINVLGHVHLVDALEKRSLLKDNCRVVDVGSEVALGIPGSPPIVLEDMDKIMTAFDGDDEMLLYGHAKGLSTLYFSAWARRNPQYHVLIVSPGVITSQHNTWSVRLPIFKLLQSPHKVGAKRCVDAVTGLWDKDYPSGTFVPCKKLFSSLTWDHQYSCMSGGEQYTDVTKQDAAFDAIQKYK